MFLAQRHIPTLLGQVYASVPPGLDPCSSRGGQPPSPPRADTTPHTTINPALARGGVHPHQLLGIDWSHTKYFAVFDGQSGQIVDKVQLIEMADGQAVVIEQGCPLSIAYELARRGTLYYIPTQAVAAYRERHSIEKSDLEDARVIWVLAQEDTPQPVTISSQKLRLVYLYHQYLYHLQGRIALNNIYKAARRHFGDEQVGGLLLFPFAAEQMEQGEEGFKKEIERLVPVLPPKLDKIKGFSPWLWAGIMVAADPRLFATKAAYRKYCGLVDRKTANYRFSRKASRVYWLLADQIIKQRTPGWREIYDSAKAELEQREGYTHPHGGAMNRLMTALANHVWDVAHQEPLMFQGLMTL